jgi:L-cysteine:1D-myo-inositol 2-amino-2-deoxy-alpha-D-glucopyranoside ligase
VAAVLTVQTPVPAATVTGMQAWSVPAPTRLPGGGLPLRLYDTLSREVTPLAPGPTASLYVCGITPYDATHLGHAATYVTYDLVQRALRDAGHEVLFVQNVTDVDDPLLERAKQTREDWRELAHREVTLFQADMAALQVIPPQHFVPVTEVIDDVAALIERLRASGATYELDGDVYFSVGSAPRFGELASLPYDEMVALARERGGDPDRAGKKDQLDPLLWQGARVGEPAWDSSLGRGRPGWHVECAAIALTRIGPTMDLHGGGTDLVFPHHEMCAALAVVASGVWPFARHWTHAAMVGLNGEKMSKSKGNLVFVHTLREQYDGATIRLALLAHHYRTDWTYTDADITTAEERRKRWAAAVSLTSAQLADDVLAGVRRHLTDDLDAPGALAVVDRWAAEALRVGGADHRAPALVRDTVDALLGVRL